ncbi:hypothetical protein [Pseudoroseicyclus sp. CXY001]|uniref:hypothetical protein n=1 Tax=Pseudoroseicyclus sp. CXY001 TaxID=3242492 RepID=UPI00358DABCE
MGLPPVGALALTLAIEAEGLTAPVTHELTLLGPGDIAGLAEGVIIRRFPEAGERAFEHNAFPLVEFADAALPWRYTPAAPSPEGRLAPWLVLAALPEEPGTRIRAAGGGRWLLEIGAEAGARLPRPEDAYAFAHVQEDAAGGTARILCPTRLDPGRAYIAALVPLFEAGRRAGLGLAPDGSAAPAWGAETGALTLPAYAHWRFSTGAAGFEELAERIFPAPPDPRLGRRPLDVTDPGPGFAAAALSPRDAGHRVSRDYAGVMVATGSAAEAPPEPHATLFAAALKEVLSAAGAPPPKRRAGYDPRRDDPVLAPPGYGAMQHPAAPLGTDWALELNLDPGLRATAGLAARAFRARQEEYVALAWEALEEARAASAEARRLRTAAHVSAGVARRLGRMPRGLVLQVTRPLHGALRTAPGAPSLAALMEALPRRPGAAASPVLARFIAARARRQLKPGRREGPEAAAELGGLGEEILAARLPGGTGLRPRSAPAPKSLSPGYALELSAPGGAAGRLRLEEDGGLTLAPVGGPASPLLNAAEARAARAHPRGPIAAALTGARGRALLAAGQGARPGPRRRLSPGALTLRKVPLAAAPRAGDFAPRSLSAPAAEAAFTACLDALPQLLAPGPRLASRLPLQTAGAAPAGAEAPLPRALAQSFRFEVAAVRDIQMRAPQVLVPGAGDVPLNGAALVAGNPTFLAAYLAGLNHEAAREFAWRGLPLPTHDTWFDRFWAYDDPARRDIAPIRSWPHDGRLAKQVEGGAESTILLIRAELLERYPETLIYAVPALWDAKAGARRVTKAELARALPPSFEGRLGPGLRYFGWDLPAAEMIGGAATGGQAKAPGWFIALEEPLFAPRFGLDAYEAPAAGQPPADLDALHWGHLVADEAGWQALRQAPAAPPWAGTPIEGLRWDAGAAAVAAMTFQAPVRVLIHADRLVSP